MNDLDKFQNLLKDVGIDYSVEQNKKLEFKILIDDKYVHQSYGNEVEIYFNEDGSFKEFQGWGE